MRKICDSMVKKGHQLSGFFTEEVRSGKGRSGFDIITLDGNKGVLSRKRSVCIGAHFS